jgi:hypothetical protein
MPDPSTPHQPHDQADDEHDEENEEQDLGDFSRARGNAAKAEDCGDDRYDEKNCGGLQHGGLLFELMPGDISFPPAAVLRVPFIRKLHAIAMESGTLLQPAHLEWEFWIAAMRSASRRAGIAKRL